MHHQWPHTWRRQFRERSVEKGSGPGLWWGDCLGNDGQGRTHGTEPSFQAEGASAEKIPQKEGPRHGKFSVTAVSASSGTAAGNKCQGRQGLNQKNPSLPFTSSVFLGRFYRLLQALISWSDHGCFCTRFSPRINKISQDKSGLRMLLPCLVPVLKYHVMTNTEIVQFRWMAIT